METVQHEINNGVIVTISAEDLPEVSKHKWRLGAGGYPQGGPDNRPLHHFIMGPRPGDVPDDYVLDHANRRSLDASRPNLRWVSRSFNGWNKVTDPPASGYRGVSYHADCDNKWVARFRDRHLGTFAEPRQAFVAYAAAAVAEWPQWAPSSDLLLGEGLLTAQEMDALQQQTPVVKMSRNVPKGVFQTKWGFNASFRNKLIGTYKTVKQAEAAYNSTVDGDLRSRWEQHQMVNPPRNEKGQTVILLSGRRGQGFQTIVPEQLWHHLTFKRSWGLMPSGYVSGRWLGKGILLHQLVYQLLHPSYVPTRAITIDHINHERSDQSEDNLRAATHSMQARNKRKRQGASSRHIGVHKFGKLWKAEFAVDGTRFRARSGAKGFTFKTEAAAFEALQVLKREVLGEDAV